jgi:hypothetical protein
MCVGLPFKLGGDSLTRPQRAHHRWGRADFFDGRRKSLFVKIAGFGPSDVLYDMGCGDASLLTYSVRNSNIAKAVGFENMPSRARRAQLMIRRAGLEDRITIEGDMYEADLSKADVIFDMMPEGRNDYGLLYGKRGKIRAGTKLIKHDLPLVGFMPDRIELPFYLMEYPFRKARSRREWAQTVLMQPGATPEDLWHELYFYRYEKSYGRSEIRDFKAMLLNRVRRP